MDICIYVWIQRMLFSLKHIVTTNHFQTLNSFTVSPDCFTHLHAAQSKNHPKAKVRPTTNCSWKSIL